MATLAHTDRRGLAACAAILALTMAQLAVLTFVPDQAQAKEKGFGARLAFYPMLMLVTPALWAAVRRVLGGTRPLPWTSFALIMAPFLVDVSGNTLDLYDRVEWWDDANHFANWVLLCSGLGLLLLRARVAPRWALAATITGAGAVFAIVWELGEWYTFIRHGTELDTAYQDTLGDETLGTLGGAVAAVLVTLVARTRERSDR
jgi:hypothetical protein